MKKDIREKWVAALRSGKYEQGQNNLRSVDNKFCCLGVLCDIIDNTKWETFEKANSAKKTYPFTYEGFSGTITNDLKKIAGLPNDKIGPLMNMNDEENKSFAEIADWIETNL